MTFTYGAVVVRPKLFQRLTGLTPAEFELLLDKFATCYELTIVQPRLTRPDRQRAAGAGVKGFLPTPADKLFFILVYTRIYPLLIIQGMFFNLAESKACKWVGILLPVLDASLDKAHVKPKRLRGRSLEEILEAFPELRELGVLSDGVERPIRRSKNPDKQKEQYSGKKKRHTNKHVTFVHPRNQYILAASHEYPGTTHDKKIVDEEQVACRSPIDIGMDSGFEGLTIGSANLILPIKKKRKPKGQPKDTLTDEQKAYNHALASARVPVEHSNAGFKRNRSVQDTLRNYRDGMGDQLTMVAMGLHNLRVTMRPSYQKR